VKEGHQRRACLGLHRRDRRPHLARGVTLTTVHELLAGSDLFVQFPVPARATNRGKPWAVVEVGHRPLSQLRAGLV